LTDPKFVCYKFRQKLFPLISNFMNTSVKNSKGFTLVEILIVVAIVGVLAAIAVPSYRYFLETARRTSSIAALDTLRTEMEGYVADQGGYPTSIDFTNFTDQNGDPVLAVNWDNIKSKIYSWDSYVFAGDTYTLKAKALDRNHTVLTLTPQEITY